MTLHTALASVINADINSSGILGMDKADLDIMEDVIIQVGYARQAKEEYDQAIKDVRNPIYTEDDQRLFLEHAADQRKAFNNAQLRLIELSEQIKVTA